MTNSKGTRGEPPRHVHIEKKKTNWLLWALLGLVLLGLLFALTRCNQKDDVATATAPEAAPAVQTSTEVAPAGLSTFGAYMAGTDPAPRTFVFEKLNFDTAKSEVRAADRAEVDAIAESLKQHPTTRIRLDGYADARGSEPANVALGKARAESVKAALVAKGVEAGRIETATGGETNPVDINSTQSGRAENRRTELVVTQR